MTEKELNETEKKNVSYFNYYTKIEIMLMGHSLPIIELCSEKYVKMYGLSIVDVHEEGHAYIWVSYENFHNYINFLNSYYKYDPNFSWKLTGCCEQE